MSNNNIKVIGDTHGKIDQLISLITPKQITIINGDIGFKQEYDKLLSYLKEVKLNDVYINMGNHDFYPYKKYSLGNYFYFQQHKLLTIRGAYSIDKSQRTIGLDYFQEEELNFKESNNLLAKIKKVKPSVIVSHDCPEIMYQTVCHNCNILGTTPKLLQEVLNVHQPDLWIFGHHHKSLNKQIGKTKFICLNELETYII